MRVLKIHSRQRGRNWHNVSELKVSTDICENNKMNDISLISNEAYVEAVNSGNKGFCHLRFKPNLVISMRNDDEIALIHNQELDIGDDVKLFVLPKQHRCHRECPLSTARGDNCEWTKHIYYTGIRNGGLIRLGDIVSLKCT